ncbi:hypothetical protein N9B60_06760 [Mariniblastus sp.]|nr:hypothetical protein [Mariniblastus sp.]
MNKVNYISYALLLTIHIVFNLCSMHNLDAQLVPNIPLKDFYGRDGTIITVGRIIEIEKSKILVRDGLGVEQEIKIRQLSHQSQVFAKQLINDQKFFSSKREKAFNLAAKLNEMSLKAKLKTIKEIQSLKITDRRTADLLLKIATTASSSDLKLSLIICFMTICESDSESYLKAIGFLQKNPACLDLIGENPKSFFRELVKFGELGEQIIICAAFDGELNFLATNFDENSEPKVFGSRDSKSKLRHLAAFFLAQVNTPLARNLTKKLIKLSEKNIDGKADFKTIEQIILGFSVRGVPNSRIMEMAVLSAKYRKVLIDAVQLWDANSSQRLKFDLKQQELKKISEMRNIYDRNEKLITRGNIKNIDSGTVVFETYKGDFLSIAISNLSNADQNWVDGKRDKN